MAMPKWRRSGAICNSNSDSGIHALFAHAPTSSALVSPAALDRELAGQKKRTRLMVTPTVPYTFISPEREIEMLVVDFFIPRLRGSLIY
ncbi:hypothetical protein ANTPLA_LOCUS8490 [Anthophora plagiata]